MLQGLAKRPFYTRVALLGIGLLLISAAIFIVAILIVSPADVAFGLIFLAPSLIVGAAIVLIRRWGLIAGVLGGLLALLVFSDGADLALSAPYAFVDFTTTVLGLAGGALLLLASAVGLVESFRGASRATARAWELTLLRGVGGVLVVLGVASLAVTVASMGSVSAADKEGATLVVAKDVEWNVEMIEAPAGRLLKIVFRNDDPFLHTLTIYDLDIDVKLGPNSEKLIVVDPGQAGVYGFVCRVVGHEEDMTGVIEFK